jgi:hypothetical protein
VGPETTSENNGFTFELVKFENKAERRTSSQGEVRTPDMDITIKEMRMALRRWCSYHVQPKPPAVLYTAPGNRTVHASLAKVRFIRFNRCSPFSGLSSLIKSKLPKTGPNNQMLDCVASFFTKRPPVPLLAFSRCG